MSIESAPTPTEPHDETPIQPIEDTGQAPVTPAAPQPPTPAVAAEPAKEAEEFVPPNVAKRREIAARFKAQRQGEGDNFDGDLTKPANLYGKENLPAGSPAALAAKAEGEEGLEPGPVEPAPGPPPQRPAGQAEPTPQPAHQGHELVVRGRTLRLTSAQLIEAAGLEPDEARVMPLRSVEKLARMNLANESYLEENKARLRDIAIREGTPPPAGAQPKAEPHRQPQPAQAQPNSSAQDDEALAERLVLGSPEEQRAAIADLRASIKADVRAEVLPESARAARAEMIGRNVADDSEQAYSAAVNEHPEFAQRTPAAATFAMHLVDLGKVAMCEAIRALPDARQAQLAQQGFHEGAIMQLTDPRQVGALFRSMQQQGWNLPRPSVVINTAKNVTLQQLGRTPGQPQPKPGTVAVTVDRSERKQGLPQQPTRAAAPPQTRTQAPSSGVVDPTAFREKAARDMLNRRKAGVRRPAG